MAEQEQGPFRPKLRRLDRIPLQRDGDDLIVLRDPLGVSDPVAVDQDFVLVLDNLDGTRTVPQLRQSLLMKHGLDVPLVELGDFVDDLRQSGLLDDDRFRAAWHQQAEAFHASPVRESSAAGTFYSERSGGLEQELRSIFPVGVSDEPAKGRLQRDTNSSSQTSAVGIIIPSQALGACPALLRGAMERLPSAVDVDLIVVIGTDFVGGLLPYAATDKGYATSRGVLHCDVELIDQLEERVPWLLREDLRHRQADGIELACLLLREAYGNRCPPALFLLCSREALHGDESQLRDELLGHLEAQLSNRRVLFVCVGELSHAGPAFGGDRLFEQQREALERYDRDCLAPLLRGQISRFASESRRPGPAGSPSGAAAFDLLLRLLPTDSVGELVGYEQLHPMGNDPGLVCVAAATFRRRRA